MSCTLTGLVSSVVRYNPQVQRKFDRLMKKHNKRARVIRSIAAIRARAVFHMLRDRQEFVVESSFNKLSMQDEVQWTVHAEQRKEAKVKRVAERCRNVAKALSMI